MKQHLLIAILMISISTASFASEDLFKSKRNHQKEFREKMRKAEMESKMNTILSKSISNTNQVMNSANVRVLATLIKRSFWNSFNNAWFENQATKLIIENDDVAGSYDLSYNLQDTFYRHLYTRDNLGRPIQELHEEYDTTTKIFTPKTRILNSYSVDGRTRTVITEFYNSVDNTWSPEMKSVSVDNERGELQSIAFYEYTGNEWLLYAKYSTRIDYLNQSSNKIVLQVDSSYQNNTMVAEYKTEIQYDINGQEQTIHTYELGTNGLYLFSIDSISYSNNIPNQVLITYFNQSGVLENKEKYYNLIFENYNPQKPIYDHNLSSYYVATNSMNNWVESARFSRSYTDDFGSFYELNETYIGNNNYRENHSITEKYNTFGANIEFIEKEYNSDSNRLVILWGNKNLLTYDANNNVTERIYQIFDNFLRVFVNNEKIEYSDFVLLNTGIKSSKVNNLEVYPNPVSNNQIVIKHDDYNNQSAELKIFDVNGKQVQTDYIRLNGIETKISLQNLNSGIYLIQFITNNKTYQSKFIKE